MNNDKKLSLIDQVLDVVKTIEDPDQVHDKMIEMGFLLSQKDDKVRTYLSKNGEIFVVDLYALKTIRIYEMVHHENYIK